MRFVVCGEALIDLIQHEHVSPAETRWRAMAGGSPLNTAVALARLGRSTQFLGRMSNDVFGAQLRDHLRASAVGLDMVVDTEQPTSLAIVSLDDQARAHYTFHFENTSNFSWERHEFPELDSDDWLHFGSIGAIVPPGRRAIASFINETQANISYDINMRTSVQPDKGQYFDDVLRLFEAVGRQGGIVRASDEDILTLVDADENDDSLSFAQAWVEQFGLAMFVITLGPRGAAAVLPDQRIIQVPGLEVDLVDTVGAGDTFTAGFLDHYVDRPDDIEGALTAGVAASALVCSRRGANPPTRQEVEAFIAQR